MLVNDESFAVNNFCLASTRFIGVTLSDLIKVACVSICSVCNLSKADFTFAFLTFLPQYTQYLFIFEWTFSLGWTGIDSIIIISREYSMGWALYVLWSSLEVDTKTFNATVNLKSDTFFFLSQLLFRIFKFHSIGYSFDIFSFLSDWKSRWLMRLRLNFVSLKGLWSLTTNCSLWLP